MTGRIRSPRRPRLHRPRAHPAALLARHRSRTPGGKASKAAPDRLTSWGTFISAIAAAAGLIVSGVATWTAVAALNDQREQSVTEAEEQTRARAGRVSVWAEETWDSKATIHIMNRSADPVVRWGLDHRFLKAGEVTRQNTYPRPHAPQPKELREWSLIVVETPLAPCSHYVFDAAKFTDRLHLEPNESGRGSIEGITFHDSTGTAWTRDLNSSLVRGSPQQFLVGLGRAVKPNQVIKEVGKAVSCNTS